MAELAYRTVTFIVGNVPCLYRLHIGIVPPVID